MNSCASVYQADFSTAFVLGSLQVTKVHDPRFVVALALFGTQSLPDLGILGLKDRKTGTLDFYPARVMKRLQQAEALEAEPYYQQHIRQAWIIVSFLQKGMTDAFVQSSYVVYGKHPSDVWPAVVADRKSRLGNEYYDWYTADDVLRPDIPKIPSVRDLENPESLTEAIAQQSEVRHA